MTDDHVARLTLLADLHDTTGSDRTRTITEHVHQQLISVEAAAAIGASPSGRTEDRVALSNGTRAPGWRPTPPPGGGSLVQRTPTRAGTTARGRRARTAVVWRARG